MKTIPEMKELTIEVKDGVIELKQERQYHGEQKIRIPVSMWNYVAEEVLCEIGETERDPTVVAES